MTPIAISLAFDSGWSDGDPGNGRVRFSTPKLSLASFICVNARDAQDSLLGELVPSWGIGDVLVIERPSAERNRVVAWIIGPITHGGSYYRVPIIVRSVSGNFTAHDEIILHHHRNVAETDEPERQAWAPKVRAPAGISSPPEYQPALARIPEIEPARTLANTPETVGRVLPTVAPAEMDRLRTDVAVLHGIIAGLLDDKTELYAVETTA